MKLIMKKDLKGVGKTGQVVEVSDGYGANFIIPRGFGVLYTPESVKEREEELARLKAIDDANRAKANENAKKLEGIVFEFVAPVDNGGRMIGTVSIKELKKALKEKLEIDVDKDDFPEHNIVNSFGMSHVKINLYKGIYGIMNVKVNPKPSK